THISALPVEILTYIFKWVVSSNLDTDSLESLALVCKSFYSLARAEDIWKLICMRTWEKNIALSSYSSFRQMFMKRPRVKFNGCYINKTTYFRSGEKSFDGLYKPMHVVHSFRYLRFYPEGTVYMLTSPKLPLNVLPDLKTRNTYVQGLLQGHYKLNNDKVGYSASYGYHKLNFSVMNKLFLNLFKFGCDGRIYE
ncbi:hypothetical protein HELRODRAFT_65544, partial [Helobdella robusta]|uniref:F-box domain-containing protein n=1 Tax=Helobdella robusta TaxID=6412 RepID=T1FY93_HELRO